ncbi:MAG TPA: nitrile hydratase subunit beta, partial [Pararhizobium sp.]|nr:nitrile hydratase subunit beta [Pararhizobium sp.]
MNGPQDLGGQMGFGPIAREHDEPVFHAEWERRGFGVTLACGAFGAWTLDESRHARESLPPVVYYTSSYYEIWTRALVDQLVACGFVSG